MRVLRVVVGHRHPFERRAEVPLHPRHQIASQPFQVGSVAELRRYDQLPEALIARLLPAFEPRRDVDGFSATVEPDRLGITLVSGALAGDVAPMGSPLSGSGVLRVHDPHRTSLVVRPSALRARADPTDRRFRLPLMRA